MKLCETMAGKKELSRILKDKQAISLDNKKNIIKTIPKMTETIAFPVLLFLSSTFKNPPFQPRVLNASNVLRSALCCGSFPLCALHRGSFQLRINPAAARRAGELSRRLSHDLGANPLPWALPRRRPSVRFAFTLGGQASAAWPNSTFQHFPHSHNPRTLSAHSPQATRIQALDMFALP